MNPVKLPPTAFLLFFVLAINNRTVADSANCGYANNEYTTFNFNCPNGKTSTHTIRLPNNISLPKLNTGVNPKLVISKNHNIFIAVTNDPVVQIVSRMAAIYLRENMGYPNVYLRTIQWEKPLSVKCSVFNQFQSMIRYDYILPYRC